MNDDFLVIKYSSRNSFEQFFSDQIQKAGVTVLDEDIIYPAPCDSNKLKKFIKLFEYKKMMRKYNYVILFADGRLPVILTYYLKKRNAKLIIWRWNSVGKIDNAFNQLKKYGEIWTFDRKDAELNGWKLNTQFYFNSDNLKYSICLKKSAFFVGDNKGREATLEELYHLLTNANVTCDFWLSNKMDDFTGIKNMDDFIPYENVINEVNRHSILVDLVKDGQTGMTIRAMEAMFYNKKLITNNINIRQAPFYSESNIFIYGYDDASKLDDFLGRPYVEVPNEIKEQYSIDQWLHNFIMDTNKK